MNIWKAVGAGFIASLVMFIVMMILVKGLGAAPFNIPPSAAFLETLGLNMGPLAPITHFVYGLVWAAIIYAIFRERTNWLRASYVAVGMWLILMVVYAPIIGWGFFGFGGPGHDLSPDAALYLGNPVKFLISTLVMHLIYGTITGWLTGMWVQPKQAS